MSARYVEVLVNDGYDDWMKVRDTQTGDVFLVGLATRETQLRILRGINMAADQEDMPLFAKASDEPASQTSG